MVQTENVNYEGAVLLKLSLINQFDCLKKDLYDEETVEQVEYLFSEHNHPQPLSNLDNLKKIKVQREWSIIFNFKNQC